MKALQGTWNAVSADVPGGDVQVTSEWVERWTLEIEKDEMKVTSFLQSERPNKVRHRVHLDPTTKPKSIDFEMLDRFGMTMPVPRGKGINMLDGNRLTLFATKAGTERPESFKSKYDPAVGEAAAVMIVWEKNNPKDR